VYTADKITIKGLFYDMQDDTKEQNDHPNDSEMFDIAVRRDDTKSIDEVMKEGDASESHDDSPSFEEKEATLPDEGTSTEEALEDGINDEPTTVEPVESPKVAETNTPEPVTPVVPVAEAAPAAAPVAVARENTPGSLVLQWLSYSFWGWFSALLAILAGISFNYYLNGSNADNWATVLAYPLAGVIVMMIVAFVTDFFYAKHEPVVKKGAASVIMLIHVVLYSLIVVGSLIAIVFSLVNLLLSSSTGSEGPYVVMMTAAVVALCYGIVSARALFGGKKPAVRKAAWLVMLLLAAAFIAASVVGPVMKASMLKDDRLIESALPSLAENIQEYTRTNDKLPANLSDVTAMNSAYDSGKVKQLVDKNLVTYKPNTKQMTAQNLGDTSATTNKSTSPTSGVSLSKMSQKTYYYQLCVTYKEKKSDRYNYGYDANMRDYTMSSISMYGGHEKGDVCYSLKADGASPLYMY
jgi:hypothetical protein